MIYFLGTGAGGPSPLRGQSSIAIRRGGEIFLFDAGEGVQQRMVKLGLSPLKPMQIFITHMHGDHVIGLLGLIQSMALLGRERKLEIYGPVGIKSFVELNAKLLNFNIPFELSISRIREGVACETPQYLVRAIRTVHTIASYAFLFEEKPRPGIFHPEKAQRLGIPKGPLWSALQHGQTIQIGTEVIKSSDVTGPPRRGRKIGISGDTRPSRRLIEFFKGVDVLIFEATFSSDKEDRARATFHSTSLEAALIAKEAEVKKLFLTHFSPRYQSVSPLVKEARKVFPETYPARDGMGLSVPLH